MSVIKKTLFDDKLEKVNVLINDTEPNSKYFKITELNDTLTGGKNAFLIQGSEYLVSDTLIKIQIKDANGDIIYHEPGEGIVSASVGGEPIVTEYYEGVSKVVAVYIYPNKTIDGNGNLADGTAFGPATITILGELKEYESNGLKLPIPDNWKDTYNVKWTRTVNVNPSLANVTKIRFYKRPTATIKELLQPLYSIDTNSGLKVDSGISQSFAQINLSNLETFAGDVKRVKVFRTSEGDISDYDLIQDVLLESKELLTTYGLSGSVIGETGIFTSETLNNYWNTGSLTAQLTSSRVESGIKLAGSGLFTYTQSLDINSANTYELNLDSFYSGTVDSNLGIYLNQITTSGDGITPLIISSSIGTLRGLSPTKNFSDTVIPFSIARNYPSASLYFSQSNGEWHLGNVSLKLSQDTAFSPDSVSFITTMPTILGNDVFNFKFEFYDLNNNYVPVFVTQSATFVGAPLNTGALVSASLSQSLDALYKVSSSISGTMTVYSSSASGSIGTVSGSVFSLSGSVSTSVSLLTGSISSSLSSSFGYTSSSVYTLSGSVSSSLSSLSSSVSQSIYQGLLPAFTKVQQLADGNYSGSFISGNIIYAPVIGGQLGYFSTLFKVGKSPNSIYLDARQTPRKIFIGGAIPGGDTEYSGAYNNSNTNVYLDSSGQFSLGNKLYFDTGGNLTVNGSINVTGGNAATDSNAQLYASRAAASASISASAVDAKVFTDSSGKLARTPSTSGAGLYLGQTYLGYYNGTDWKTYMANNGNFYLTGTGTNRLYWDGNSLTISGIISASAGYFSGNITSTATISGGTISGGTITGGSINGGTITGGSITGTTIEGNTIIGGILSGSVVTSTSGLIGGWTIGNNKIYIPNAITLDAGSPTSTTDKNITFYDSAGVGRIFIKQADSFASRVSTGGLSNQTAGFFSSGAPGNTVTRDVGGTFTADSGKTFVVSVVVQNSDGNTAMTTANAYNLDAYNDIYLETVGGPNNGARRSILSVQASLTYSGEYGEGFINSTTWTAVNGRTAQITLNGDGQTYKVVQIFNWNQGGNPAVLYTYSMVGIRWDAVAVGSFVEIIAGGIQVARDSANYVIMDRAGSSPMLQVGGNISVTGSASLTGDLTANTSSDIRLKENIVKIPNAIDKVLKISGNTFKWKEGYGNIHPHKGNDVGIIAQEIENVLPSVVITRENGYKGVQYEKLVALLIEAIKELKKEIDELKNK